MPGDTPARREATPEEFKAMAHPLRLRILRLCLHEARTNKEIAVELGKDPATTLYHVRMLVRTGFLRAEKVRTGQRGALEKPYRATRKSWVLSAPRPEDDAVATLASIDAFRAEVADTLPGGMLEGARLGLKLSDEAAEELSTRIQALVMELAERDFDREGQEYGLFIGLHRRRP
ncbi:MAG TPA: winged helix-turn-helix domain-containing protein [Jiangellaceae bacterium]|nr:winged helix-turn-helix domain-containing protein [Jiangellaceae bacterium]